MKQNRKGFTLIELLAVIVILAIILLIATPTVLNLIEDARRGAARNSAMGYIDALEKHIMAEQLKDNNAYLNTTLGMDDRDFVEIRGEKPNGLSLSIDSGVVTSGTIKFGEYEFTVTNGQVSNEPN